jgi:hypothetical protein
LIALWKRRPSRDRARLRWSTEKIGWAAIVSSALSQHSIITEWKSQLNVNCSWVPMLSGFSGMASRKRPMSCALARRAASPAAGTSSSSGISRNSLSETSRESLSSEIPVWTRSEMWSTVGSVT